MSLEIKHLIRLVEKSWLNKKQQTELQEILRLGLESKIKLRLKHFDNYKTTNSGTTLSNNKYALEKLNVATSTQTLLFDYYKYLDK